MDDDPAEEDDDFEVDLEAVDVVSVASAVASLGANALASDSILATKAPVIQVSLIDLFSFFVPRSRGGICRVHTTIAANRTTRHHKKQEERHLIILH